jgi:TolA-binding protein
MADPRRLRIERQGGVASRLLEAAREDAPPEGAQARAMAALGLGTPACPEHGCGDARDAVAEATRVSAHGATSVATWFGVGAIAVIVSAVMYWTPSADKRTARSPQQPISRAIVQVAPTPTAQAAPAPSRSELAAPKPVARAPRVHTSRLAQEVAALDAVRAALGSGDTKRGFALLASYARDFPAGELAPEATLLRVEALLASDRRERAAQVARAFLRANPSSHYADKIVQLFKGATRDDFVITGARVGHVGK